MHLDRLLKKKKKHTHTDCRGTKYNPSFGQNTGILKNWLQHITRMPHNRFPRIVKTTGQRQKKPVETTKETSRCVRPERVNKWPISMLAR